MCGLWEAGAGVTCAQAYEPSNIFSVGLVYPPGLARVHRLVNRHRSDRVRQALRDLARVPDESTPPKSVVIDPLVLLVWLLIGAPTLILVGFFLGLLAA